MTEFEKTILKLSEESESLQKRELQLRAEMGLFNDKLGGFLKESGLPENFTVPQLLKFAINKSKPALVTL